jgi:CubicO group peptidase (beta-lactamase class C family)
VDLPRPADVGTRNWIDPPQNRWAFRHVRELTRTARIWRGPGPARHVDTDWRDLGELRFHHLGRTWTIDEMLAATHTDALVVLHRGRLVYEQYLDGMSPHDTHLLMSVSKSLCATLVGIYVDRGLIRLDATVPDHIAELRGTSWEGCTVQHLLDMRAGTRFDEDDYDDPHSYGRLIEEISGYVPRTRDDLPADTAAVIRILDNAGPHGGPFVYRSILTDVLGWIVEEVSGERFHEVFGREIWSRIGAEHDADVIVDAGGMALVEGGICTTARDLARFGQMHLDRGRVGDDQVVPEWWVDRVRRPDAELVEAFMAYATGPIAEAFPHAHYHDKWWVLDASAGIYAGRGINGQTLLVHHPSQTVVVKFSVWPDRLVLDTVDLTDAGLLAMCDHLGTTAG